MRPTRMFPFIADSNVSLSSVDHGFTVIVFGMKRVGQRLLLSGKIKKSKHVSVGSGICLGTFLHLDPPIFLILCFFFEYLNLIFPIQLL
jgi:hypothetical protein